MHRYPDKLCSLDPKEYLYGRLCIVKAMAQYLHDTRCLTQNPYRGPITSIDDKEKTDVLNVFRIDFVNWVFASLTLDQHPIPYRTKISVESRSEASSHRLLSNADAHRSVHLPCCVTTKSDARTTILLLTVNKFSLIL